ncbi:hypothetical protein GCM10018952_47650 [Streptosporangium vulgare]
MLANHPARTATSKTPSQAPRKAHGPGAERRVRSPGAPAGFAPRAEEDENLYTGVLAGYEVEEGRRQRKRRGRILVHVR